MLGRYRGRITTLAFVLLLSLPLLSFGVQGVKGDGSGYAHQTAVTSPQAYEGADTTGGRLVIEPEVAAGPSHVMEVVQGACQVFFKQYGTTQGCWMSQITGTISACDSIGDSRVLFDPSAGTNGRWFIATIHESFSSCPGIGYNGNDCSHSNHQQWLVDVAVSPTNDPSTFLASWPFTQYWTDYHILIGPVGSQYCNIDSQGIDHPQIAVTNDKFVLTTNSQSVVIACRKADLINFVSNPVCQNSTLPQGTTLLGSSQNPTLTIPSQCGGNQPYPVHNYGSTTREYMICGSSTFYLFWIDGSPGGATVYPVPPQSPPAIVTLQYGAASHCSVVSNTACASKHGGALPGYITFTGPPLSLSAVWSNRVIWFATTAGCSFSDGIHDCISLTQVSAYAPPSDPMVNISQNANLNQTGMDFFLPALSIDGAGDLGLIFGYSSPVIDPSLGITGQTTSDVPGALVTWKTLKQGSWYSSPANGRFSDYFGAATDPSDSSLIWVAGGYYNSPSCSTNPCWASWVASVRLVGLALSTTPASLTVYPGAVGSSNVTVQGLYGFSGRVNLTAGISPYLSGGPRASVSRSSVQVRLGMSNYTLATVDASTVITPGPYSLYVTAQTPDLTVTLTIPVSVPYFDFTGVSPSILAYTQGTASSVPSTITLTSRLGFTGTVSLSLQVPSGSGITAYLGASAVTPPPGGSVSFAVNVWISASTPGGTYQVKVFGTYGSYSQFVILTVQVASVVCTASASPTSGRLSVTVSFSVTCLAGVSSLTWYFNDDSGATSTAQNITYPYYWSPGGGSVQRFSPTVTVKDGDGNTYHPGVPVITLTCTSGCPTRPSP